MAPSDTLHKLRFPLAPQINKAERPPLTGPAQEWPHRAGDNHGVGLRFGCDASGHIHVVPPEIEHKAALAHDARDNRPLMHADANVPARPVLIGGLHHCQPTFGRAQSWVLDVAKQTGSGHKGVADGLYLFQAVSFDDLLKTGDQRLKLGDHLLRRIALAIFGEADDIAEQHGDILVPLRKRPRIRFKLVDDRLRKDAVQELIHAGFLSSELLDKKALLITNRLRS